MDFQHNISVCFSGEVFQEGAQARLDIGLFVMCVRTGLM